MINKKKMKKRDILTILSFLLDIYLICSLIFKYTIFMQKQNECKWKELVTIKISFSIAIWVSISCLILILVIQSIRKYKNIDKHNFLFSVMTYTVKSSVYPFLNILNLIPFDSCSFNKKNSITNKLMITEPFVYRIFLYIFYTIIVCNLVALLFYKLLDDKKLNASKIIKYLVNTIWVFINFLFLILSLVPWILCLQFDWSTLILCLLLPLGIIFDIILYLCLKYCCCVHDYNSINIK